MWNEIIFHAGRKKIHELISEYQLREIPLPGGMWQCLKSFLQRNWASPMSVDQQPCPPDTSAVFPLQVNVDFPSTAGSTPPTLCPRCSHAYFDTYPPPVCYLIKWILLRPLLFNVQEEPDSISWRLTLEQCRGWVPTTLPHTYFPLKMWRFAW